MLVSSFLSIVRLLVYILSTCLCLLEVRTTVLHLMLLFDQSQLEVDVNNLVNVTNNVVVNSSNLVDQINTVINNITGNRLPTFLDEVRNY